MIFVLWRMECWNGGFDLFVSVDTLSMIEIKYHCNRCATIRVDEPWPRCSGRNTTKSSTTCFVLNNSEWGSMWLSWESCRHVLNISLSWPNVIKIRFWRRCIVQGFTFLYLHHASVPCCDDHNPRLIQKILKIFGRAFLKHHHIINNSKVESLMWIHSFCKFYD